VTLNQRVIVEAFTGMAEQGLASQIGNIDKLLLGRHP
jgi:hypothetical protein